jgi:hypothetical protein
MLKSLLKRLRSKLPQPPLTIPTESTVGKKHNQPWDDKPWTGSVKYESHKHPAVAPVIIGGFPVYLGACRDIDPDTVDKMDYVCALNGYMPNTYFGTVTNHINCELVDRGGVPKCWPEFIDFIVGLLKDDAKILAYCVGGHGRTGTFGASLISVLEPETPDPIDAIRARHCHKAVESCAQAKAVFALRKRSLPLRYLAEFYVPVSSVTYTPTKGAPSTPGSQTAIPL